MWGECSKPQKIRRDSDIQLQARLANRTGRIQWETQTDWPAHVYPRLHSENRPSMFLFFFFLNIIHVCISTVYVFFLLLYYKIPWWPVQKETEGEKEGREGGLLSNLTYSRNQWWEKRRGAQCLDLSIGRSTLCQINPSQIGRKRQEGGRAEGWGRARRSARSLCYSVGSSSRGQLVCLLAGLLSVCNLLVLLPSSLPGWSDRSTEVWLARVAPNRRTDGFALSDEGRQRQIQHGDVTEMCFMFQIHFWSKVWSWCYIYFTVSCAQPTTC